MTSQDLCMFDLETLPFQSQAAFIPMELWK